MIKDIILKRRKELNMTQAQLANKLNVSDKVISKWETGRGIPNTYILNDLAKALEISLQQLLEQATTDIKSEEFESEAIFKYNSLIAIVGVIQIASSLFILLGRYLYNINNYVGYSLLSYILGIIGLLISGVIYFIFSRKYNELYLKNKIFKSANDKILLFDLLLISVCIIIFVALHGLIFYESVIVFLISEFILVVIFLILRHLNKKI